MEKKKTSKKKIKVRKSPVSPIVSCTSVENFFIPVVALDSAWSGIAFREPEQVTQEHTQDIPEEEIEIKIIDCDVTNEEPTPPILLLFPDLSKEDSQIQVPLVKGEISTRTLTKLLVGKKPKMSLLRHRKKPCFKQKLSPVEELTESETSIEIIHKHPKRKSNADEASAFADVSSNDESSINENSLSKQSRRKQNLTNESVEKDSRDDVTEIVRKTLADIIGPVFDEADENKFSTVDSTAKCDEKDSPTSFCKTLIEVEIDKILNE
ncbi:uncharacterized protein isoform X1 [Leptinotarsa decemlineata]|uniref:uncharacterized protein isoform X1 n=1 Tax=Leptinotarsa decemlineata TaxID=7539 RepID=UPI003D30C078